MFCSFYLHALFLALYKYTYTDTKTNTRLWFLSPLPQLLTHSTAKIAYMHKVKHICVYACLCPCPCLCLCFFICCNVNLARILSHTVRRMPNKKWCCEGEWKLTAPNIRKWRSRGIPRLLYSSSMNHSQNSIKFPTWWKCSRLFWTCWICQKVQICSSHSITGK